MDQIVHGGWIQPGFANAVEDAFNRVARGGEALRVLDFLRRLVKSNQVGERAADIHGDPQTHSVLSFPSLQAGRRSARIGTLVVVILHVQRSGHHGNMKVFLFKGGNLGLVHQC